MSAEFDALRADIKKLAGIIPDLLKVISDTRAEKAKAVADSEAALTLAEQAHADNAVLKAQLDDLAKKLEAASSNPAPAPVEDYAGAHQDIADALALVPADVSGAAQPAPVAPETPAPVVGPTAPAPTEASPAQPVADVSASPLDVHPAFQG